MSTHENDELIDYDDENDAGTTTAPPTAGNGAAIAKATDGTAGGETNKEKRVHVGVHSTGFRSV